MNAFFRYSTEKEIVEFGNMLSKCFSKMNLITEAKEIVNLMLQFFPMDDTIAMAGLLPPMIRSFKEYMLQQEAPKDLVSCIMKICYRL